MSERTSLRPRTFLRTPPLAFTINGRQDKELDTRIDKARAVMQALHYSSRHETRIVKKESYQFSRAFVLIFTYSHESWVMTERVRSRVQASKTKFLKESKNLHYLTRCVVLRFKNF